MKLFVLPSQSEQSSRTVQILAHLFLIGQLVLLTWFARLYEIEQALHIPDLVMVATLGFILHLAVPTRLKLTFFLFLGFIALVYFIGWMDALLGIGYGMTLYLLLEFVTPTRLKLILSLLMIAIPVGLLAQKGVWVRTHMNAFSLFGSMTIYRLLIYIYDKQHQKEKPSRIQDLAYFFMLPNMALTLFPAVDYTRWVTNYHKEEAILIQKKGVQWMVLGISHLMIYRLLYYYLALPLAEVDDLNTFIWHAISTYILILRLSGIFHLAAGILCLFGYNMTPVFNNYFLASGFSDIWRRLNIYFRDFMVKIFYYPVYFKIRHLGNRRATILAILSMFIISWMLHSYQWFWFKGTFPLKWVDVVFWNTWGILVAASVFLPKNLWRDRANNSLIFFAAINITKIMATFLTMSILWSLWSAASFLDWARPVRLALASPLDQWLNILKYGLAIWVLGGILIYMRERFKLASFFNPDPSTSTASFWSLTILGILAILRFGPVHQAIGQIFHVEINGLLTAKLSAADEELQVDGYYTELLYENNLTSPLAGMQTTGRIQFQHTEGARIISGFRYLSMRPNTSITFKGQPFTINNWGFRDKEYTLEPGPNTVRSMFMGGSFVAGSGVADHDVVDVVLEKKMNNGTSEQSYEFLNLGCPHYDLLECVIQFDEDHLEKFKPQYLFYFSHGKDLHRNNKDILKSFKQDYHLPYNFLDHAIQRSGIEKSMTDQEILDHLKPFGEEILEETYAELMKHCRANNIIPIWVYWPTVDTRGSQIEAKNLVRNIAERSGFKILDLEHIYDGHDKLDLKISKEDIHPSVKNHQLVADTLFQFINNELLPKYGGSK